MSNKFTIRALMFLLPQMFDDLLRFPTIFLQWF